MKIVLGADHGGVLLKNEIAERLKAEGHELCDVGVHEETRVDYPDKAVEACHMMQEKQADFVILCCGTGLGMSMAANKLPGIRAALLADSYSARMAKEHNNANCLCLGGRTVGIEKAMDMLKAYMGASFLGDRHARRVAKIDALAAK